MNLRAIGILNPGLGRAPVDFLFAAGRYLSIEDGEGGGPPPDDGHDELDNGCEGWIAVPVAIGVLIASMGGSMLGWGVLGG